MTVIAWDGKNLAADRQLTMGNTRTECIKVHRLKNGEAMAVCGAGDTSFALMEWYRNGAKNEDFPNNRSELEGMKGEAEAYLIVAKPGFDGLWLYCRFPQGEYLPSKKQAFGCGENFALAALALGQTARQAVLFTSEHDIYCGMGVDNIVVNASPSKKKKPTKKKAKK